jgi:hypothetical protein
VLCVCLYKHNINIITSLLLLCIFEIHCLLELAGFDRKECKKQTNKEKKKKVRKKVRNKLLTIKSFLCRYFRNVNVTVVNPILVINIYKNVLLFFFFLPPFVFLFYNNNVYNVHVLLYSLFVIIAT